MTIRSVTTISALALLSACSSQPGPSAVDASTQAYNAFRAGNIAAAEKAYDTALIANPNDVSALVGLGEVYEKTGRTSEAIKLYTQAQKKRSGTIRVWNDGRVMQDGLTELANRRLSALGHQEQAIAKVSQPTAPVAKAPVQTARPLGLIPPQPIAPVVAAPLQPIVSAAPLYGKHEIVATPAIAPQATQYQTDNSGYALDSEGIVYYAEAETTQPISTHHGNAVPYAEAQVTQAFATHSGGTVYYADPEATQPITAHLGGTIYYADPEATQPITGHVSELPIASSQSYLPHNASIQPALATTSIAPSEIAPSPVYQTTTPLAPVHVEIPAQTGIATYQTDPIVYETAPVSNLVSRVPTVKPSPSVAAPAPSVARNSITRTPSQPLPRSQPGYAVIEGDLVYISAEDIANGAVGRPVADPVEFDPLNGTSIPNLN